MGLYGEKTVIVTRQHPQGHFTMGVYLVDIYCKGLLHSEYFFNMNHDDYEMMVKRIDMDEDLKKQRMPMPISWCMVLSILPKL